MAALGYKPLLLLQHPLRLCKALFKKKKQPGFVADNKTIVSNAFVHHCKLICICYIKQHFRTIFLVKVNLYAPALCCVSR